MDAPESNTSPQITELPEPSLPLQTSDGLFPYPNGTIGTYPTTSSTGTDLTRGTSFDFAAASVAAPSTALRYMPSFDANYGPPTNPLSIPTRDGDTTEQYSDRVTLLPDENSQPIAPITLLSPPLSSADGLKVDAASNDGPQDFLADEAPLESADKPWNLRKSSKRRSHPPNLYDDFIVPANTTPRSFPTLKKPKLPDSTEAPRPSTQVPAEIANVDLAQTDTRQFLDLLSRNQNVSVPPPPCFAVC